MSEVPPSKSGPLHIQSAAYGITLRDGQPQVHGVAASIFVPGELRHAPAAFVLYKQSGGPRPGWVRWTDEEIEIRERNDGRGAAGALVLREIRELLAALLPQQGKERGRTTKARPG